MIYRALTPVKKVSGGGIKRPAQQVGSVDHITFKDTNKLVLPSCFKVSHPVTFAALIM